MGIYFAPFNASPPSITSPVTLSILPIVTSPTGTLIGLPVAVTTAPRDRPSVELKEIARTVVSDRCCTTSMTIFSLPRNTSKASLISGNFPLENSMSTTTPTICMIVPVSCFFGIKILLPIALGH